MIGRTVSHYEVLGRLGHGGMGVVYRTRDTRLGREVALKFLTSHLLADKGALQRFRREGRLASALNHPGICTVHDVDEHDGHPFIVMELIEGVPLTRLLDGALPIRRALDLTIDIVEALAEAHSQGIIHRDVKPANVFVTPGGHAKVLDFGLARGTAVGPSDDTALTASPTESAFDDTVTAPGVKVGTAAYMSPEQARGERLDARSDLFSVGAVLYEMVTGVRAFPGQNVALISDHILNREPVPPGVLNSGLSPAVQQIILRALQKRREDRYQAAEEMLQALRGCTDAADSGESPPLPALPVARGSGGRWKPAVAAVAAVAIGLAVAIPTLGRFGAASPLTDRDSILIADFVNTTGEAVFDDTLKQALSIQLAQSPFLDIVPESRVQATLTMMNRPDTARVSGPLAREVCVRANVKALMQPSIARVGSVYVITLEAEDCALGRSIAAADAHAERKEDVLRALGSITSVVRQKLGETDLKGFDVPIEQATTPSLEALQAYTAGRALRAKGAELESVPFFVRALELDPEFAAAHTVLSTVYGALGEWARSEEYARNAYARRGRVSERERFLITYQFHDRVTGDQLESARTLDLWKQTFRRDFAPANARALIFNRLGLFERAIDEANDALARQPDHPFPLSNLAYAYRGLGRYGDARRTAQRAVDLKVETASTRRLLYQLDLMDGLREAAEVHLRWAKDRPREFDLLAARAQWLAWQGRMREAREQYRHVIDLAQRRNLPETALGYSAHLALTEALHGNLEAARATAEASLFGRQAGSVSLGAVPRFRATAARARAGDPARAEEIAREMQRRYPQSTVVNSVLTPVVRAAVALRRGHATDAVVALRAAVDMELGTVASLVPPYLRGLAYLDAKDATGAAQAFQRILDHRGTDPFAPVCSLAQLGLARALALGADAERARVAYATFLTAWSGADPDLPILREAKAEAERLATTVPSNTQ
jgi:serine/threonine protein kinase/tetratricopeptide (TPR) repeat protein